VAPSNGAGLGAGSEPTGQRPIDPGGILRALRASAIPVALAVLAVTVVAYLLASNATKHYSATATIVGDTSSATTTDAATDARLLATNLARLNSARVLDAAARRLPGETRASLQSKVTATTASDANVIDVTAEDISAAGAARMANTVARTFLTQHAADQRATIARTRQALERSIAAITASGGRAADVAALRSSLDDLVVESANAGRDLQLTDPAEPPASAIAPRPLRVAVLAFLGALALAVLIVALREHWAPAGRREADGLADVPLLASLPEAPGASAWDRALAAMARRPPPGMRPMLDAAAARRGRSRAARAARVRTQTDEALRSMLATILLELPPRDRRVILVASPEHGPRSAWLTANLARALAEAGEETLALSSDLGSRLLTDALGVAFTPGLSQALEQARTGTAVLNAVPVPGVDALSVVPGGGPPRDGVGLMRPDAVEALFAAFASGQYTYVVIDTPGLLTSPEGRIVAAHADAAVLASPVSSSPAELEELRRLLEGLDVRVLGAVGVPARTAATPRARDSRPAMRRATVDAPPPAPAVEEDATPAPTANGSGGHSAEALVLLKYLRAVGRPLTFAELVDALGGDTPPARVRQCTRELLDAGEIERRGAGRRGDPFLYSLPEA
jgi:Mrp family chromosome partitioning ATPase/capsular polysaccharide biosynthesis protein